MSIGVRIQGSRPPSDDDDDDGGGGGDGDEESDRRRRRREEEGLEPWTNQSEQEYIHSGECYRSYRGL